MIEHRVDATTTIRVTPVTWGGGHVAVEYRAGYRIDAIGDGPTAQAALDKALRVLQTRDDHEQAADALTAAGIYAALTDVVPGIRRQMQALAPSPARPGECPTCGLDSRTCDCH